MKKKTLFFVMALMAISLTPAQAAEYLDEAYSKEPACVSEQNSAIDPVWTNLFCKRIDILWSHSTGGGTHSNQRGPRFVTKAFMIVSLSKGTINVTYAYDTNSDKGVMRDLVGTIKDEKMIIALNPVVRIEIEKPAGAINMRWIMDSETRGTFISTGTGTVR
ncbi:MAG: hypothetical protein ABSH25_09750 [Syntrophorhabdales bacterium]|jgi:hypothetical protein